MPNLIEILEGVKNLEEAFKKLEGKLMITLPINGRDISIIVKSYQDFVVLSNGDNSLIEAIYPYGSLVMYCFKEKE